MFWRKGAVELRLISSEWAKTAYWNSCINWQHAEYGSCTPTLSGTLGGAITYFQHQFYSRNTRNTYDVWRISKETLWAWHMHLETSWIRLKSFTSCILVARSEHNYYIHVHRASQYIHPAASPWAEKRDHVGDKPDINIFQYLKSNKPQLISKTYRFTCQFAHAEIDVMLRWKRNFDLVTLSGVRVA